MDYTELIEFFGGDVNEAAYKLKVTTATIYNYRASGIPPKSLLYIENRIKELKMDQEQAKELENERYYKLMQAFADCLAAKVSDDTLDTLRFETGFNTNDLDNMTEKQSEVE